MLNEELYGLKVIIDSTNLNAGGLISNDFTHTIYNRQGKPVWFMPRQNLHFDATGKKIMTRSINQPLTSFRSDISPLFNLTLNPFGTVTYVTAGRAVECDLSGNILWQAPDDGKVSGNFSESYNHDFKRLPNGHYMVLGEELLRKLPPYTDTSAMLIKWPRRKVIDSMEYAEVMFGTVIEYDKQANLTWSWNSDSYFDKDPLSPLKDISQLHCELDPHINAFCTDPGDKFVYVSFRNVSRVVKVEKSSGKVVDSWGIQLPASSANEIVNFHRQHGVTILKDGSLAIFNSNDSPDKDSIADVVVFSQSAADKGKILWNYAMDSIDQCSIRSGGSIDELANGNLLVCTGTLNRILEITHNKKIVWEASVTTPDDQKEMILRLNTAHYVSSLYPCYFTMHVSKDTVMAGRSDLSVTIFNNGTDSDTYNIKAYSSSGGYSYMFSSPVIAPGRSMVFGIKPDVQIASGDKIDIVVTSGTNHDFIRKREIKVADKSGL